MALKGLRGWSEPYPKSALSLLQQNIYSLGLKASRLFHFFTQMLKGICQHLHIQVSVPPLQKPCLGKLRTNPGDAVMAENNLGARALAPPAELATHLTELPPDAKPSSLGKEPDTMRSQLWPLRWGVEVVIESVAIKVTRVPLRDWWSPRWASSKGVCLYLGLRVMEVQPSFGCICSGICVQTLVLWPCWCALQPRKLEKISLSFSVWGLFARPFSSLCIFTESNTKDMFFSPKKVPRKLLNPMCAVNAQYLRFSVQGSI